MALLEAVVSSILDAWVSALVGVLAVPVAASMVILARGGGVPRRSNQAVAFGRQWAEVADAPAWMRADMYANILFRYVVWHTGTGLFLALEVFLGCAAVILLPLLVLGWPAMLIPLAFLAMAVFLEWRRQILSRPLWAKIWKMAHEEPKTSEATDLEAAFKIVAAWYRTKKPWSPLGDGVSSAAAVSIESKDQALP